MRLRTVRRRGHDPVAVPCERRDSTVATIMESISAIILGLLLMLPLLVQLQSLAVQPWKLLATLQCYLTESARDVRYSRRNLVQCYPTPDLLSANSESTMIVCCPTRAALSLPTLPRPVASSADDGATTRGEGAPGETVTLARQSSSFVATQIELPVVDIGQSYNSYRYNIVGQNLMMRYGDNYPPGHVVLNFLHLNMPDTRFSVGENKGITCDPLEMEDDAGTYSSVSTRPETEYLNLMDHFVSRRRRKPPTVGKFTEMLSPDDKSVETSSRASTWSQSTLPSSVNQEKEFRSCGNQQRPLKDTKYTRS